jgi:hypothetical protein
LQLSILRKVFWPSAIALGFLVFLGAIGSGNALKSVSADEGDLCKIEGPAVMGEGQTAFFVGWLDADTDHEFIASIDNISGSSKITSLVEESDKGKNDNKDPKKNDDEAHNDNDLEYEHITGANVISDLASVDVLDADDDLLADLAVVDEKFVLKINACGDTTSVALKRIIADLILIGAGSDMSASEQAAAAAAIEALLVAGEDIDCGQVATEAGKAAAGAGATTGQSRELAEAIEVVCENDFVLDEDVCEEVVEELEEISATSGTNKISTDDCEEEDESFLDAAVIVDVTCNEAGNFEITFTDEDEDDDALSFEVVCLGAPDSTSTIARTPDSVEIVPSMGNVSHSLITVTLLADGEQAGAGFEVDFTVDRCTIETSGVDTAAEYGAARTVFTALNRNYAPSADAIETSPAAVAAVDSTRQQDTTVAFANTAGDATIAAAILGCNPADTGATPATPGVATITAVIEVEDGQDVVLRTTVTVIGPPASVTVAAAPSSLRCGEKATITATIKDAIGQNVSEHTRVESVTNAGGVLGGTGAVAGNAGPVVPISSTVAETFSGVATFYLLTSEQHSGPYEVVVTTGGSGAVTSALGGVFSTPPVSAQATVSCSIPQVAAPVAPVAPTVTAPRTGQGSISPPNTGDAGLVGSSDSSSWALFAAVGAVAFAVAGFASLKFARNR